MFDIGWFELFFVIVVSVVVVGPKDLPKMMRAIGRWTGRARAMADQFRRSFEDMARQSELEEMRAEMMKIQNEKSLAEIKRETDEMLGNLPSKPTQPLNDPPKAGASQNSIAKPAAAPSEDAASTSSAQTSDAPPSTPPSTPSPSTSPGGEPAADADKTGPSAPEPQSPLHRDEP